MTGYIYIITNEINGKQYVGQTIKNVRDRWYLHCCPTNKSNSALTKAIIKYGKNNFKINSIEQIEDNNRECLLEKLNILEKCYINAFNSLVPNGYNILIGGKNTKRPINLVNKIANSLKGNPRMKSWLGKKFSESHKENLSKANRFAKPLFCLENNKKYRSIANASKELIYLEQLYLNL
jgi:group I intron endonuclease